eukprot:CAMPEP_0183505044 /NCGR_PEP_ID=MMETSP0371-20130417/6407_1 /TAXON_ID=268820 /ORGANISM="Peridinium aciculiferum, Strain PAER-2" /LENGTH=56 /DNA_ID=CAMNT_0025700641 /DNA_START=13 /DNA_END=181 /DNA_ORIENTATION=+
MSSKAPMAAMKLLTSSLFDKPTPAAPQHSTQVRALTMDQAKSQAEHHHAEQGAQGR